MSKSKLHSHVSCAREVLTISRSCKAAMRECLLTYNFDSDMDKLISAWHRGCDSHLSSSLTTPLLTPLSTVYNVDDCSSAADACVQRSYGAASCKSAYTGATESLNCLCQPTQVSLASRCKIDGTKCFETTSLAISDIWEYKNCRPTGWIELGSITEVRSYYSCLIHSSFVYDLLISMHDLLISMHDFNRPQVQHSHPAELLIHQ